MRKLFGLLLFLSFTVACTPQSETTQSAAPPILSGSCTMGKWESYGSNNLNLTISSEFSAGEKTTLEQAATEWNSAIAGKTFFNVPFNQAASTGFATVNEFKDNKFGIYKSHAWFSDVSSQALAITQFYGYVRSNASLGNYIDLTEADIIVNYRDFGNKFTTTLPAYFQDYDLPTVVVHEMGHFLGLCHERNHPSIMQPYYYSTQRTLMAYDKTKINDLYTNNTITAKMATKPVANSLGMPNGTPVRGIIELMANGKCRHYINGKLTYEHIAHLK